jgi:hypothetical protein
MAALNLAFKSSYPVKITDPDSGGVVFEGKLSPMSGEAREAFFQDSLASRDAGGEVEKQVAPGLLARTVCRCLRSADGKQAEFAVVQSWDAEVLDQLFTACLEISGLNKEAETEAKKN